RQVEYAVRVDRQRGGRRNAGQPAPRVGGEALAGHVGLRREAGRQRELRGGGGIDERERREQDGRQGRACGRSHGRMRPCGRGARQTPPLGGPAQDDRMSRMGLEQQLTDTLTKAMKDKDLRTADAVRMLKTKLQERRTSKGFAGTVDDALVLDVIAAYRKQLQKALAEFEKVGERGAEQAAQLRFEIEFCERWLPRGMDEAALRAV